MSAITRTVADPCIGVADLQGILRQRCLEEGRDLNAYVKDIAGEITAKAVHGRLNDVVGLSLIHI
eukprot:220498-Alexandrium_andersonii.AAC.1